MHINTTILGKSKVKCELMKRAFPKNYEAYKYLLYLLYCYLHFSNFLDKNIYLY